MAKVKKKARAAAKAAGGRVKNPRMVAAQRRRRARERGGVPKALKPKLRYHSTIHLDPRQRQRTVVAPHARTCPFCGVAPDARPRGSAFIIRCVQVDCRVRPHVSAISALAALAAWNARTTKGAVIESDEEWTTKDGRSLPVWEMDDSHVRNILRLIIRRRRRFALERATSFIENMFNGDPDVDIGSDDE